MKKLIILAFLFAPSLAFAQYYSQPPSSQLPGGFHNRQGRIAFGFSLGLGGMNDDFGDIECSGCDYSTLAGQLSVHLGGFIGPRLALMGEIHGNAQTLSSDRYTGETDTLVQTALMIAGQYWVTPQLWVKGGVGFANLQVNRSYYGDGIIDESSVPENGLALMGAVGFELLSARNFSIDLQGRLINGSYDSIDNNITAGSIGIGINWF
ncbi:MAG: hypothetical protein ACTHU0_27780 [Kofleriaceae bacterium]